MSKSGRELATHQIHYAGQTMRVTREGAVQVARAIQESIDTNACCLLTIGSSETDSAALVIGPNVPILITGPNLGT